MVESAGEDDVSNEYLKLGLHFRYVFYCLDTHDINDEIFFLQKYDLQLVLPFNSWLIKFGVFTQAQ